MICIHFALACDFALAWACAQVLLLYVLRLRVPEDSMNCCIQTEMILLGVRL
jgi:hypothetical protein